MGGVCINTGTIPSKTMREAVLHLSGYNYQNIYGVNYRVKEKISMADLAFRVQHVIRTEIDVTQSQLSRNNIEVLTGTASFIDPTQFAWTVRTRRGRYRGGQRSSSPRAPSRRVSARSRINGRTIINSDQILDMPEIPRDADRGGRRRDRRRVRLHVRRPWACGSS